MDCTTQNRNCITLHYTTLRSLFLIPTVASYIASYVCVVSKSIDY